MTDATSSLSLHLCDPSVSEVQQQSRCFGTWRRTGGKQRYLQLSTEQITWNQISKFSCLKVRALWLPAEVGMKEVEGGGPPVWERCTCQLVIAGGLEKPLPDTRAPPETAPDTLRRWEACGCCWCSWLRPQLRGSSPGEFTACTKTDIYSECRSEILWSWSSFSNLVQVPW